MCYTAQKEYNSAKEEQKNVKELYLSHFNIVELVNKNGRINRAKLGASTNYFAVLKNGYAILHDSKTRVELFPGELLYIPSGSPYTSEWYGEPTCDFYSVPFHFRYLSQNGCFSLQKLTDHTVDFTSIMTRMVEKIQTSPAGALSEFYALYEWAAPRLTRPEVAINRSRISVAIDHMETHISDPFDVPLLARMCGMSESGFYREFKSLTGYTPIAYKNLLRCRLATELLCNTNDTVEVIAEKTGCTDASYLRRLLSSVVGKTPKKIRADGLMI